MISVGFPMHSTPALGEFWAGEVRRIAGLHVMVGYVWGKHDKGMNNAWSPVFWR